MAGERRVSAITVPIRADTTPFVKGLDKGRKDAEHFRTGVTRQFSLMGTGIADSLEKINKKLHALGGTNIGVLTKGIAGLAAAATAAAATIGTIGFKRILDMGKAAESIGVSVDALSRLRSVAKASGDDVDDLGEFIAGLTEKINASVGHTTDASQAFRALGTSAEELQKLKPEEQIAKLNKGFAALADGPEKARIAKLIGGLKVFRTLAQDADKFQANFDAAPIVTEEQVSEAKKLQAALDKISDTLVNMAEVFTSKLLPPFTQAADLLASIAGKFGIVSNVSRPAAATTSAVKPPVAQPAAKAAADQQAIAEHQAKAEQARSDAQAKVARLQAQFDKQNDQIARTRPAFVPSTNRGSVKLRRDQQQMLNRRAETGGQLGIAKQEAAKAEAAGKTQAQAMADALRGNSKLTTSINDLKDEYRQTIESAGKDDIHRRVDALKGIGPADRKALVRQGLQAREAGKTTALRDELQESTKLPIEKLSEDLARIDRMVKLGPEAGGLTRLQGLRAAAQKTAESGLGGPTQFAGALSANSVEGRSYLLQAISAQVNDPIAVAREGNRLTGQGNAILQGIERALTSGREQVASF